MHLCECEHPTYVYNRYLDKDVRVNCGKCNSCLNSRAKTWISRLLQESQLHKYVFMVNLTYDDLHLPSLGWSEDMESLVWDDHHSHLDSIPLSELTSLIDNDRDRYYLSSRLADPLGLPVLCNDDIQRFLKRLNKHIHDNYTQTYENFRYFICGEYGGATYRCHYHGEFFIDDERVANNFQQIISSCWSLGDSPVSCIYSNGGSVYVAQYVNMLCHLPSFYSHPKLRQRQLFSKSPSIGTRTLLAEEVRDIYDRKPIKRTVWDSMSSKYVDLSESSSVKDRFFPKCPQYNTRSLADRIPLYRCTEILPAQDFQEFRSSVNLLAWLSSRHLCSKQQSVIDLYIKDLQRNAKNPNSFRSSLYRLYLTGKRAVYIARCLNSSVDYVARQIDEYYKKVDYYKLKDFYKWQSEYVLGHPVQDLMFAYPDFVRDYEYAEKFPRSCLSPSFWYALESFKIDTLNPPLLKNTFDYKRMVAKSFKIYKDTHKRHDINAYRYSKRLNNLNPSLQKILIKYDKWQNVT